MAKQLLTSQQVRGLYQAFFKRDPNENEVNYWTGKDPQTLRMRLIETQPYEFRDRGLDRSGNPVATKMPQSINYLGSEVPALSSTYNSLVKRYLEPLQSEADKLRQQQLKTLESMKPHSQRYLEAQKQFRLPEVQQQLNQTRQQISNIKNQYLQAFEKQRNSTNLTDYIQGTIARGKRQMALELQPLVDLQNNLQADYAIKDRLLARYLDAVDKDNEMLMKRYGLALEAVQDRINRAEDTIKNTINLFSSDRDLMLENIKTQIQSQNPDIVVRDYTDAQGNVTLVGIDKNTGEEVYRQNLGKVGKGFKYGGSATAGVSSKYLTGSKDVDTLLKKYPKEYQDFVLERIATLGDEFLQNISTPEGLRLDYEMWVANKKPLSTEKENEEVNRYVGYILSGKKPYVDKNGNPNWNAVPANIRDKVMSMIDVEVENDGLWSKVIDFIF